MSEKEHLSGRVDEPRYGIPANVFSEFNGKYPDWHSREFAVAFEQFSSTFESGPRKGSFLSADFLTHPNIEKIEPFLLLLKIDADNWDFKYIYTGSDVVVHNKRPLVGNSIGGMLDRNHSRYGVFGLQAELLCLYMKAMQKQRIVGITLHFSVLVDELNGVHEAKNMDICAAPCSSHGLYADHVIGLSVIRPVVSN